MNTDTRSLIPQCFSVDDPYPIYARIRKLGPVQRDKESGYWWAFDYESVRALTFASHSEAAGLNLFPSEYGDRPLFKLLKKTLLDPPEHTRFRAPLARCLGRAKVETLREEIANVVDDLLDDLARKAASSGTVEFVSQFTEPLPVSAVAKLLGVSEMDANIVPCLRSLSAALGPGASKANIEAGDCAANYLVDWAANHMQVSEKGPISLLLHLQESGDVVSESDFIASMVSILFAGIQTTSYQIGNSLLALLRFPEQLKFFHESKGDASTAVEELLRFDTSMQFRSRYITEDVEVKDGVIIPAESNVIAMVGSAHRDPEYFDRPDELDLRRAPNPHLAFGGGIHYCLGASLARLVLTVSLPALVERFPNLRIAGECKRSAGGAFRGFDQILLVLGAS
ncbi:cytochrome P450 [Streptomyces sp. NPDC015127]|uniref:cytochrome P450 n=1 Tax=Streptomyces sp. NPDC015127 TaxID=3364939 RepID=UPI0036F769BC